MRGALVVSITVAFSVPSFAQSLTSGATLPFTPRAIGDVDGDGVDDIAGTNGGNLVVLSGATGIAIPQLTRPTAGFGYFRIGDTNADGHDDVLFVNGSATVLSGATGTALHVWPPTALFTNYTSFPGGADFDGDGFGDVVLVTSFQLHEIRSGRTGGLLFSQSFGSQIQAVIVAIGDTDGDGFDDVVFSIPSFGVMHIAKGPDLQTTVVASGQPRPLGDVNGNGATDRAVRPSGATSTSIVDGATGAVIGTLPYVTTFAHNVTSLGDLDGDGRHDFFASQEPQLLPPSPGFGDVVSGATLLPMAGSTNVVNVLGDVDGDGRDEAYTVTNTIVEWVDPAVPVASSLKRRGASGTTSVGTKPRITTRGSCALGNQVFFDVRGTLPTSISVFVIGAALDIDLTSFGAPGNRVYANPDAALLLLSDPAGHATQSFTMPTTPSLLGATVSVQAVNADPAVTNPFGLVWSNAIDIATNN